MVSLRLLENQELSKSKEMVLPCVSSDGSGCGSDGSGDGSVASSSNLLLFSHLLAVLSYPISDPVAFFSGAPARWRDGAQSGLVSSYSSDGLPAL